VFVHLGGLAHMYCVVRLEYGVTRNAFCSGFINLAHSICAYLYGDLVCIALSLFDIKQYLSSRSEIPGTPVELRRTGAFWREVGKMMNCFFIHLARAWFEIDCRDGAGCGAFNPWTARWISAGTKGLVRQIVVLHAFSSCDESVVADGNAGW
uniref:Uncharacterized protein n=1 Tax=Aegilops tauschii subsp. strangulata TaxID=200361 RepID=A0A453H3N6_AEGTS